MNLRHIPLEGAFNFRDLGGYPTTDGRYTKWGLIYRSDSLANLTKNDWKDLRRRNIRTILDFRGQDEIESAPIDTPKGIDYHNIPLMKDIYEMDNFNEILLKGTKIEASTIVSMVMEYERTVFGNPEGFANTLNILTKNLLRGSLVFICSAGKDRTGMTAALILYLCDVIHEDIVADYSVSNIYNSKGINTQMNDMAKEYIGFIKNAEALKDIFDSKAETMINLLNEFDKRDIKKVLDENGFNKAAQRKLRNLFTLPVSLEKLLFPDA